MVTRHLRRNDDPQPSHEGARRLSPTHESKKQRVLDLLLDAQGGWVPRQDLLEVGGAEATRRFRELRAAGWDGRVCYLNGTATAYRIQPVVRRQLRK